MTGVDEVELGSEQQLKRQAFEDTLASWLKKIYEENPPESILRKPPTPEEAAENDAKRVADIWAEQGLPMIRGDSPLPTESTEYDLDRLVAQCHRILEGLVNETELKDMRANPDSLPNEPKFKKAEIVNRVVGVLEPLLL